MIPDEIEDRLTGFQTRRTTPAMRARLLTTAREEWLLRSAERRALWRFIGRWFASVSAAVIICAGISWREESATARYVASRPGTVDPFDRALREVCADVGLNHGYAARWAFMIRERTASRWYRATLWEVLVVE